jgi:hypothetical protein
VIKQFKALKAHRAFPETKQPRYVGETGFYNHCPGFYQLKPGPGKNQYCSPNPGAGQAFYIDSGYSLNRPKTILIYNF